jgi:hypothetical protein
LNVVTCREAGRLGFDDAAQLEFSTSLGRVLYSANVRDYVRIHWDWVRSERQHSGIIVCNYQEWSIGEQIRRLTQVTEQYSAEGMTSKLMHLSSFG